jgi:hypothetical protein
MAIDFTQEPHHEEVRSRVRAIAAYEDTGSTNAAAGGHPV